MPNETVYFNGRLYKDTCQSSFEAPRGKHRPPSSLEEWRANIPCVSVGRVILAVWCEDVTKSSLSDLHVEVDMDSTTSEHISPCT